MFFLSAEECVCSEMPLAQIQWTVLIGGTGGGMYASDSSEVVNSMEERSRGLSWP